MAQSDTGAPGRKGRAARGRRPLPRLGAGGGPQAPSAGGMRGPAGAGAAAPGAAGEAARGAKAKAAAGAAAAAGTSGPPRGVGGFRQVGSFAKPPMREAAARFGFAETRVLTDWATIAGVELSALCRPLRVSYSGKGFGATLIVLAEGARAPEVEMLGPRIVERVNAHYGYRAVSRLKVVQSDRSMGAGPGSQGSDRPAAPRGGDDPVSGALSSEVERRAAAAAEGVEDPGLRAALERLAREVLARNAKRRDGDDG